MFPELKRPRWHIVKFLNKVKHLTPAWTLLKLPWWFSQFYCLSFCWLISSVHIAAHTDEKEVRNHISQCCFWKLCDTTCQLLNNPTLILTLAVLLQFTPPVPAVVTHSMQMLENFPLLKRLMWLKRKSRLQDTCCFYSLTLSVKGWKVVCTFDSTASCLSVCVEYKA